MTKEKQAKNSTRGDEKKVKDSENRYRRLFETAQDGILILEADTGRISDVNPFLMRMLGRTREALLGKRLWEIGPFKDIAASKVAFEELQRQKYIRYEDLPLETSDGRHLDVEFVSNVYEVDHQRVIQCNIRDITNQKLVEEALRESERKLDRILQTIVDGLVIVDLGGQIVFANRSAGTILGITKDEMLGKYFSNREWHQIDELGRPYPPERLPLAIALNEQREVDLVEHPVIDPDGQIKWLSINAAPLFDENRKLYGAVASFRDITGRKQAESTQDWLASFPERNPSPVVEVDLEGNVYYLNPAARNLFPDLQERGKEHTWLSGLEPIFEDFQKGNTSSANRDVRIGAATYQQAIFFVEESQRVRIYSMDVTDRTRAEEDLRQVRDELEIRVQERTQELNQTNEQLLIEIAERQRLAQNLHDAVNQSLFSAGLIAEVLPRLWERDQTAARKSLEDLRRLTRGAQAEMRALLAELRPSALTEAELGDLLRLLGNGLAGRANIPVNVRVTGEGGLPAEVQVALYRMCQEALNNIARHAGASQVEIALKHETGAVELHIHDNGRGFDVRKPAPADHYGLSMMRERAEAVGAVLMIKSRPGGGTDIVIRWQEEPDKEVLKP
jgi:PAS domain S-box-containing protein